MFALTVTRSVRSHDIGSANISGSDVEKLGPSPNVASSLERKLSHLGATLYLIRRAAVEIDVSPRSYSARCRFCSAISSSVRCFLLRDIVKTAAHPVSASPLDSRMFAVRRGGWHACIPHLPAHAFRRDDECYWGEDDLNSAPAFRYKHTRGIREDGSRYFNYSNVTHIILPRKRQRTRSP